MAHYGIVVVSITLSVNSLSVSKAMEGDECQPHLCVVEQLANCLMYASALPAHPYNM